MIRKVTDAWGLSRNLTMEGGRTRYIGTRYHYNDTYGTMMDRKAAQPRIHPATVTLRIMSGVVTDSRVTTSS